MRKIPSLGILRSPHHDWRGLFLLYQVSIANDLDLQSTIPSYAYAGIKRAILWMPTTLLVFVAISGLPLPHV